MDFRKEWFRHRILNYFGETDSNLFDIFFQRDNDFILKQLNSFLDDETDCVVDINRQVFIIYKTYYSKIVHEEVEVQEEVTKQRSSSFLSQDDKKRDRKGKKKKKGKKSRDIKVDDDDDDEDYIKHDDEANLNFDAKADDIDEDDKQKKKKNKKAKSGGRFSPYTMMENVPLEEQTMKPRGMVSYVTVKKKIEKVIQVPQFQGYFGIIDGDKLEQSNYFVYIVKKSNCRIPNCATIEEANAQMPSYFAVGSLTENVFQNLGKILNLVFLPLFRDRCLSVTEQVKSIEFDGIRMHKRPSYYYLQNHTNSFNVVKAELSINSDKSFLYDQLENFINPEIERDWEESYSKLIDLVEVVEWAQIQLRAENKFEIPVSYRQFDWENSDVIDEVIKDCKNIVQACNDKMDSQCDDILVYDYANENLMSEFEHWKQMEINLSTVVDELNSSLLNRITGIVKIHHLPLFDLFEAKRSTLLRKYVSVKENADVLQTLQFLFRILMYSEFKIISTSIPTLMDSLQTVWILSDYYSNENNMGRVLIDIKNTFGRRAKEACDVTKLFKNLWKDIKDDLENAVLMLHTWKNSYLEVRARIESTRDHFIHRWEFNKQKLFSETDYISSVIDDIKIIFEVVESYRCLFNSKFRKMTEHTAEFRNLEQKIFNLTTPIEKVDFDIYLEIFRDEWQEILDIFQQDVIEVDQRLKILMIKTFSQIKSIKEGVEVVKNFSEIQTRPTVHESVPYICNKIIAHFTKEISLTDRLFEKNKLTHATVKIYDSITWANKLIQNLQETTESLQNLRSLYTSANFQEVLELFENFSVRARNYTRQIFKEWCAIATSLIKDTLMENLIEIEEAEKSVDLKKLVEMPKMNKTTLINDKNSKFPFSSSNTTRDKDIGFGALSITLKWIARSKIMAENAIKKQRLEILKQIEQAHKISWLEFVGESLLIEKGFRFKMKFQDDIFEILKESENLRKVGFILPDEICELLSIKDDLSRSTKSIGNVLKKYNEVIERELQPAKILLMKKYLQEMEMAIQPGLGLYTWRCTALENYVQKISIKLDELDCLLHQANEIFKKLDSNIKMIENLNFLPLKNITAENIKCEEFFREMDIRQKNEALKCLHIYNTISMTLIQIESLILLTNTGRSHLMTHYYVSYSDKIVLVLIKSVLNSISDLDALLCGELSVFFHIKIFLENNEIKLNPTCAELYHHMKIVMIRVFSRLKCLKQWEPGSCMVGRQSAEIFYVRIILDENVKFNCEQLLKNIQNLCNALKISTTRWLRYSILWKYDKQITIKQFADENPQLNDYEMRFDFYSNVTSNIEQEKLIMNVFCVNIETNRLIEALKNHCYEWKCNLGAQLTFDTRLCMNKISDTILKLNISLNKEIKNENDLTEVLRTINEIQEVAFDMELKFYKIEEHYHELVMQNFTVTDSDEQIFYQLKIRWQELYDKSLYRKYYLEEAKQLIVDSMKRKISNFIIECEEFADKYAAEESKFRSFDFDIAIEFILTYSRRCAELYEKKKCLEVVQSCYEIAPFDFKFFISMKNELQVLREEFKLLEK